MLIEGINTTEGTGGAGFYFDYSSLEEVFLGTTGQSAEMPNPGVQCQFIAQVGRQPVPGRVPPRLVQQLAPGLEPARRLPRRRPRSTTVSASARTATRSTATTITTINAGGPIKKDKVWWFGTYRTQFNAVAQPSFNFDKTFDTKLWNAVGKVTYQANQKNKFIGYYQWGQKTQPNRLPYSTYTYTSPGRPTSRTRAAGSTRPNGTARSATRSISKRATATSATTSRCSPTAPTTLFRDTGASTSTGAHQRCSSIAIASSTTSRRPTSSTRRDGQPHLQGGRRGAA